MSEIFYLENYDGFGFWSMRCF